MEVFLSQFLLVIKEVTIGQGSEIQKIYCALNVGEDFICHLVLVNFKHRGHDSIPARLMSIRANITKSGHCLFLLYNYSCRMEKDWRDMLAGLLWCQCTTPLCLVTLGSKEQVHVDKLGERS